MSDDDDSFGLGLFWPDQTNDVALPLPWWLGPRRKVLGEVEGETYVDIEHPRLLRWVELALARLIDIEGWGEAVRDRKVEVVDLTFDHVDARSSIGPHSGGKGSVSYGVAVPTPVAESHDLHMVATWLLNSAMTATFDLSDQLKIARPKLRLASPEPSNARLYTPDEASRSGHRIADLWEHSENSRRVQYLATARFQSLDSLKSVREALRSAGVRLGRTSLVVEGRLRKSSSSGEIPLHYDFTALQYPMYLEDLMSRRSTLLLAWRAVDGLAPSTRELKEFRTELLRIFASAPVEPVVSGIDGRVLWAALGLRESETPILERYRVDTGLKAFLEEEEEHYGGANHEESSMPETVAIDPDSRYAKYVGRTSQGQQYFLTFPFDPDPDGTVDFLALYVFDQDGTLLSADIRKLGRRGEKNADDSVADEQELLTSLGDRTVERIVFKPFVFRNFGMEFGLRSTESFGSWRVNAIPGDYMEFLAPWDSGVYDT